MLDAAASLLRTVGPGAVSVMLSSAASLREAAASSGRCRFSAVEGEHHLIGAQSEMALVFLSEDHE